MRTLVMPLLLVLCLVAAVNGQIRLVPDQYSSIQAAVDSSVSGDTVLVSEGSYTENIRIDGKSIVLGSLFLIDGDTSHIAATVIDGSEPAHPDSGSVVALFRRGSGASVIKGLTIKGGTGTVVSGDVEPVRAGGGILCVESDPRIEHNVIIRNRLAGFGMAAGAGIAALGDFPGFDILVSHNTVVENVIEATGFALGGGIMIQMTGTVRNNRVSSNSAFSSNGIAFAGGILAGSQSDSGLRVTIEANQVESNSATSTDPNFFAGGGGIGVEAIRMLVSGNELLQNSIGSASVGAGAGILIVEIPDDGGSLIGNTIRDNSVESGVGLGGGIMVAGTNGFLVDKNRISENRSDIGGGIALDESYATLRRNVIDANAAMEVGGGVWVDNLYVRTSDRLEGRSVSRLNKRLGALQTTLHASTEPTALSKVEARRSELINNTIVNNQSAGPLGAGGIFVVVASPFLHNSIVWGNQAPTHPQIRGAVSATYSLVQGGIDGRGNIDADPLFTDEETYHLSAISPAIDAGDPDPRFDDREDSTNVGMARPPALGTIRNDIGATGGAEQPAGADDFLGPVFSEFMEQVRSAPVSQRQSLADSFLAAIETTPLIEENHVVYFLHKGAVGSVTVPGDANGWDPEAFPMRPIGGTDLWYREAVFEPDARLDYKFISDGSWILDPRNPRLVTGGFGPNSELAMPEFAQPTEIEPRSGVASGRLSSMTVTSDILGNTRSIQIYTPAGYDQADSDSFAVIFFHDGTDYTSFASARVVLDNLIAQDRIEPLIAVFVPPVERDNEYAFSTTDAYERFVVEEVMPLVDDRYRTMRRPEMRAMTGPSFGGLITTQICYNRPDQFAKCAAISPSYWANNMSVFNLVADGPVVPVEWYFDWGSYETGIAATGFALAQALIEKRGGKKEEITWNEWHDGHSWGNWRAHMKEFLELFFPGKQATASEGEILPSESSLYQNFPNPFSRQTTIAFQMGVPSEISLKIFDATGRLMTEVASGRFEQGRHQVTWESEGAASGVYFSRLEINGRSFTGTLVLLR